MIVTKVYGGMMELSIDMEEFRSLALLMDELAYIAQESHDWESFSPGLVRRAQSLAALFTVATVATKYQHSVNPHTSVTFRRETGTPVWTMPD